MLSSQEGECAGRRSRKVGVVEEKGPRNWTWAAIRKFGVRMGRRSLRLPGSDWLATDATTGATRRNNGREIGCPCKRGRNSVHEYIFIRWKSTNIGD
jgi:hypothetical protein